MSSVSDNLDLLAGQISITLKWVNEQNISKINPILYKSATLRQQQRQKKANAQLLF
jgi:hypothetical protein